MTVTPRPPRSRRALTALLLTVICLLSIVFSATGQTLHGDDEPPEPYLHDQLVVKLDPNSGATIDDINADYNTTTIGIILASAEIYLLQTAPGDDSHDVAELMDPGGGQDGDPRIIYAEANYLSDLPEGNPQDVWAWGGFDPTPIEEQYAPDLLKLPQAHALGATGSGAVVAVVDTGFQLDHPYLADAWAPGGYDFIDDDDLPEDVADGLDNDDDDQIDEAWGHGTHVAGIIHQVAPDATIMPLRALDSDGRSNLFLIAEAINHAAANGADVVNLSLGTAYDSDMVLDVVQQVAAQGVVVVAAAGNLGNSVEQYPAAYPQAVGVASVDQNRVRAPSSNYGLWVDIVAPGVSIYSSFPVDGYAWWSGTSMATPFIAGEAALLRGLVPELTAAQVRGLIGLTAVSVADVNPGYGNLLGDGLPDLEAAVQYLLPPPTDTITFSTVGALDLGFGIIGPEDIVSYQPATGQWELAFDGSAHGVSGNIDALLRYQGHYVLSFADPTTVPGVGTVDDSDLVLFNTTTNTFVMAFDGSDVGLDTDDEDVDAIAVIGGRLAVSTSGPFAVTGLTGQDEDVLLLENAVFGAATSGTWLLYFDGSDVGLGNDDNRDVQAMWYDGAAVRLYAVGAGTFTLGGMTITPTDIAYCGLTATGSTTACAPVGSGIYWQGAGVGLMSGIDALDLVPGGAQPVRVPALDALLR